MKPDWIDERGVISLDRLPTPDEATLFVEVTLQEPVIPCIIVLEYRLQNCGTEDEHPADWEFLLACGCIAFYCDSVYAKMRPQLNRGAGIVCEECDVTGQPVYVGRIR